MGNELDPNVAAAAQDAVIPGLVLVNGDATPEGQQEIPYPAMALQALAALSGQPVDDVIKEMATIAGTDEATMRRMLTEETNPDNMETIQRAVRGYVAQHGEAIDRNIEDAEYLAALPQEARDAVRDYMEYMGYSVPRNAPDAPQDPQEEARAIQRSAQMAREESGQSFSQTLEAMFIRFFLELFGLGDYADQILGGMGYSSSLGTSAVGGAPARVVDDPELQNIINSTENRGTLAGVINLANNLVGVAESGTNGGAIVRASNGYEGDPWCGGFMRLLFEENRLGRVYDQGDPLMAQSYMREGQEHGAFRQPGSGYTPQVGDAIVFSSDRGPGSGHVGIVTDVASDGTVTYVSGNSSDMVAARTFNVNSPPNRLLGYTDTRALAEAKGVDLGLEAQAPVQQVAISQGQGRDI